MEFAVELMLSVGDPLVVIDDQADVGVLWRRTVGDSWLGVWGIEAVDNDSGGGSGYVSWVNLRHSGSRQHYQRPNRGIPSHRLRGRFCYRKTSTHTRGSFTSTSLYRLDHLQHMEVQAGSWKFGSLHPAE